MSRSAESSRNSDGYKPTGVPTALKVIQRLQGRSNEGEYEKISPVQIVRLEEKKYVGASVTSAFQDVRGIGEVSRFFTESKRDIQSKVNIDQYVCLHFANEIVFTDIYCMEVSELTTIPDGMIGFPCRAAAMHKFTPRMKIRTA